MTTVMRAGIEASTASSYWCHSLKPPIVMRDLSVWATSYITSPEIGSMTMVAKARLARFCLPFAMKGRTCPSALWNVITISRRPSPRSTWTVTSRVSRRTSSPSLSCMTFSSTMPRIFAIRTSMPDLNGIKFLPLLYNTNPFSSRVRPNKKMHRFLMEEPANRCCWEGQGAPRSGVALVAPGPEALLHDGELALVLAVIEQLAHGEEHLLLHAVGVLEERTPLGTHGRGHRTLVRVDERQDLGDRVGHGESQGQKDSLFFRAQCHHVLLGRVVCAVR